MLLAEIPSDPFVLLVMGIVLAACILAIGCEIVSIIFSESPDDKEE